MTENIIDRLALDANDTVVIRGATEHLLKKINLKEINSDNKDSDVRFELALNSLKTASKQSQLLLLNRRRQLLWGNIDPEDYI